MTTDWLGKPRAESATRRLKELNPHVEVEAVPSNLDDNLADELVQRSDIVVDAAPLFQERFALNAASVRHGKPLVECAMYDLDAQLTTMIPGRSPCLKCLYPEDPPHWKREFPVFGAVEHHMLKEMCHACLSFFQLVPRASVDCDVGGNNPREIIAQRNNDHM